MPESISLSSVALELARHSTQSLRSQPGLLQIRYLTDISHLPSAELKLEHKSLHSLQRYQGKKGKAG
ncbi:hypothetical protein VTK56DRAFT_9724 [Thermocarpiscus australiensis]